MKDANKFITVAERDALKQRDADFDDILKALETEGAPSESELVTIQLNSRTVELECRAPDSEAIWVLQQEGFVNVEDPTEDKDAVIGSIGDDEDDEPKVKRVLNRPAFYRELIAGCYYFKGTQRKVWTEENKATIGRLKREITEKLAEPAMKLSGFLDKKQKEEMEGNSEQAVVNGPSSTSPTS